MGGARTQHTLLASRAMPAPERFTRGRVFVFGGIYKLGESDNSNESASTLGSVIDSRHELIACIGSRATGAVYRAKHICIGRMVAIKLAKPEVSSIPEVTDRFEREALAIGLISHPNCASVVDSH